MQPGEIAVRTFELAELRLLAEPEDAELNRLSNHGRSLGAEAASAWRSSVSEWMSAGSGV